MGRLRCGIPEAENIRGQMEWAGIRILLALGVQLGLIYVLFSAA